MSFVWGPIPAAADAGGGGAVLVSIKVTPNPAFIRGAGTRQFTAIGSYNDGSAADVTASSTWASTATVVATVGAGTGLATGVAPGATTITATIGAVVGSALLTVTAGFVSVGNYQFVAAIEGWPYLMTDGDPAAAATAWAGTPWDGKPALGGMALEGMIEQTIDPFDPSPAGGEGGTLYLSFTPDEDDIIGIATHRTDAGGEAFLTSSIDVASASIPLSSTGSFPAAPGELCIGTETIGYSAIGGGAATVSQRGLYCPFGVSGDPHFGRHHRVATFNFTGPELKPVVTEHHRVWIGRQVGIWEHTKTGGVLNTMTQAKRLFAGIVVGVRDARGLTVLTLQSIRDTVNDTLLLRDQFSGQVREGIYLAVGGTFQLHESIETSGVPITHDAAALEVFVGAAGANQIEVGYHTLEELFSALNNWAVSERIAGNIVGTYQFSLSTTVDGEPTGEPGYRTKLVANIPTAASGFHGHFTFTGTGAGPFKAWSHMGFDTDEIDDEAEGNVSTSFLSPNAPIRWNLIKLVSPSSVVETESHEGTWQSQATKLPPEALNATGGDTSLSYGFLLFDNRVVFLVSQDSTDTTGNTFNVVGAMHTLGDPFPGNEQLRVFRRYGEAPIRLTQIFILADTFAALVTALLVSTGTAGYNDGGSGYDVLPYGLGCAVPETLLAGGTAEAFYERLLALPGGDLPKQVKIDKPKTFRDALSGDFLPQIAHLIWRIGTPGGSFNDGVLTIGHWVTPTIATATVSLTEGNKAAPADTADDQRSTSDLTNKWAKNVAKFEFARTFDGRYTDRILVIDPVSVDANGAAPVTIPTPNMDRAAVEASLEVFVPWFPTVSRPMRIVRRTIDLSLFYTSNVLDPCVIADDDVRDPTTGRRGSTRPGIIIRHAILLGGWIPGTDDVATPVGEVDIALLPVDRIVPWSPAARVDDTASAGGFSAGYNAGTKTLRLKVNGYSQSPDPQDETYFNPGYAIEVTQVDPDNPGSPLSWVDVIVSRSTTDIVLTTGLSVPAWDATKFYFVRPRAWASVTAAQRLAAFEADDADGLIQNLRAPFEYGATVNTIGSPPAAHTDRPERYATAADGDGVALDVGYEHGAARLLNNLVDHRTAISSPCMDNVVRAGSGTGKRLLVMLRRVHMNPQILTGGMEREVEVRGWFRSKTGGSTTMYVTLSRSKPAETPGEATRENVTFPSGAATVSWTTTSTASWTTAVVADLSTSPIDSDGNVWMSVEVSGDGECRGCPLVRMKERT